MTLLRDLPYALRLLRRERSVAMLLVGTLAPGIGGATAIFSVVEAVLLRPLPYRDEPEPRRQRWRDTPGAHGRPVDADHAAARRDA